MSDADLSQPSGPIGEAALRTIAMPADANPSGDIFGGWLLSQMDLAASTVAVARARSRVVTIGIEAMKFHQPVLVGDEVSCYCTLARVGRTSMTVKVETWTLKSITGERRKVTEGLFTFVAIGPDRKPRPVDRSD